MLITTPPTTAPLVSVLLPCRNASGTLESCLRSIERQTERDWECVCVDDGSSDATPQILEARAAVDPRFRVVTAAGRGLVAALNQGLTRCRGRVVARMDADDLMHRRRLADQLALLERDTDLAAAGCHVRMFPRTGLTDGTRAYEDWLNAIDSPRRVQREAWIECPVAHPTLMIHRDVMTRFGYRDTGWPEDYDLVLRLLTAGNAIGMLPRRRLAWRRHPEQLSRTDPRYGTDRFTRCKADFLARTFLADDDRYILWGHGGTGRTLRRALRAHGKTPTHIVEVHSGRVGNTIDGAEVIPIERLPTIPRLPLLVSVAGLEARTEIREALTRLGFEELRDYLCTA